MIPLFADPVLDVARETALIATQRMLTWADLLTAASVDAKDGGNDLVTAADAEIEALVRHHLSVCRLGDTMVGEEGAAARALADVEGGEQVEGLLAQAAEAGAALRSQQRPGEDASVGGATGVEATGASADWSDLVWHVDPIDGTVNFVRGIEHFCFSVGVRQASADPAAPDDGWVAGLVAAPLLDRVWFAAPEERCRVLIRCGCAAVRTTLSCVPTGPRSPTTRTSCPWSAPRTPPSARSTASVS